MDTDDIRTQAARCHADAKLADACLSADQSQIDRAYEWAAETYPEDTAEQREIMAAGALSNIVAVDITRAERAAYEASPDAARRDRMMAAFFAGEDWASA